MKSSTRLHFEKWAVCNILFQKVCFSKCTDSSIIYFISCRTVCNTLFHFLKKFSFIWSSLSCIRGSFWKLIWWIKYSLTSIIEFVDLKLPFFSMFLTARAIYPIQEEVICWLGILFLCLFWHLQISCQVKNLRIYFVF